MNSSRRRALQALGAAGASVLAGCTLTARGNGSPANGSDGCDPDATGDQPPSFGTHDHRITAEDAASDRVFGAALAIDGDTALVGSFVASEDSDLAGAAHVFEHGDDGWSQIGRLVPGDEGKRKYFGFSVALAGDTAIVGAPRTDETEGGVGSAHLFERGDGGWSEAATLAPEDVDVLTSFGWTVALAGGDAFVGAPERQRSEPTGVYVYGDDGWSRKAKLTPESDSRAVKFGSGLATDATTVLVGAYVSGFVDDVPEDVEPTGHVYQREGGDWTRTATLTDGDYGGEGRPSMFGSAVAFAGDTALVGNPGAGKLGDPGPNAGSATVFERSDDGWATGATLTAADRDGGDRFGKTVALTCGGTALVGAPFNVNENGNGTGAAYVFASEDGEWSQREAVVSDGKRANEVRAFGRSLALNDDTALISGRWEEDSVYAYDLSRS